MRILPLLALAMFAAPAFAQTVMLNFSFPEIRTAIEGLKSVIQKEEVTSEGVRWVEAKDADGLIFAVYGLECDSKEATQRCRGAEFMVSFKLDDADDVPEALEGIDYAAVADYAGDEGRLKLSRYIIFDEGITPGNLRVNIEVFLDISHDVWDYLDEEGYLS